MALVKCTTSVAYLYRTQSTEVLSRLRLFRRTRSVFDVVDIKSVTDEKLDGGVYGNSN